MGNNSFDHNMADSQGTEVGFMEPAAFDVEKYQEYEAGFIAKNAAFWNAKSGVAVYRRFRVPCVFSSGCKDMERSLGFQLAGLKESMKFKGDIANFLEPWYGIGPVASAFGLDYIWPENQAPAMVPRFSTVRGALFVEPIPVEKTEIGRLTLERIDYFLEKTSGKIPLGFCDVQSPLNTASAVIDINRLFLEIYDNPDPYRILLEKIADLTCDFLVRQKTRIGEALVFPGHGFASSRSFRGLGMSDDNILMISGDTYETFDVPVRERMGREFGGIAFHSCGNWTKKIPAVKKIKNLVMVDGAFSSQTDPDPNDGPLFREGFADTGITVNARIAGGEETIAGMVRELWKPGMKLIVTTYCRTREEQERVYDKVHEICGC